MVLTLNDLLNRLAIIVEWVFLIIIISYYFLMLKKHKRLTGKPKFKGITILIPARNEERYLKQTLQAVVNARFQGLKQVIVINDASTDNTLSIAKEFKKRFEKRLANKKASTEILILNNKKHSGKANSLNQGLKHAKHELVAVVDADSVIHKNALQSIAKYFADKKVAGVCAIVKVKNRKKIIGMWLHIEQLYNNLLRSFFSKINANITTPGPLSVYKKQALLEVKGFGSEGFLEDVDIAVKLVRKGFKVLVAEDAVTETNMPVSVKGFLKQRTRFARGWIHVLKKHLRLGRHVIDYYTLPLAIFWYVQALVMGFFISSQIITGYVKYFLLKNMVFNLQVLKYFFEWFSIVGVAKWVYGIIIGSVPLTHYNLVSLMATLLSYPLYFIAIAKYDKKLDVLHVIPLSFMFPYWFVIMIIYVINIPELFKPVRLNKWEKVN